MGNYVGHQDTGPIRVARHLGGTGLEPVTPPAVGVSRPFTRRVHAEPLILCRVWVSIRCLNQQTGDTQ